jgi:hypothetical protein
MLFARGFILQEKKILTKKLAEKKLFTTRTFLTALCRRPYPGPPSACHRPWRQPADRPRSHWVIWVIWVTVFYCKLAPVAGGHWVIWVIYFA